MPIFDVFPRHNLNNEAVPWARALESDIREVSYRNANADLDVTGTNRSTAGQMGVLGRQVEDLRSRTTQVVNVGRVSTSLALPGNYGLNTTTLSTTVRLAPPFDGKLRSVVLFLSGIAYNSDNNSNGTVYASVNGIVSKPMAAPAFTSVPPGYTETLSISTVIDTGFQFPIDMFLLASNNTPTGRTIQIGMDNIQVTAVYGDVV